MHLLPLLIVVSLALPAGAAAETLYKWTDAEGITHYSDAPPPEGSDVEARQIKVDPAPPPVAAAPPAAADAAAEAAAAPTASENCTRVRANVETLQGSAEVRMDLDGDGTAELLTPPQRDAQLEIAQRQVTVYCTPGTDDAGTPADGEAGDATRDGTQATGNDTGGGTATGRDRDGYDAGDENDTGR